MTLKLNITPLFHNEKYKYPNYFQRIDECIFLGLLPIIIIDGKSQTGKSTLAKYICRTYDKNFITTFRMEQILEWLGWVDEEWRSGRSYNVKGRFIMYDEPQADAPTTDFQSPRNKIVKKFFSMSGMLKIGLVMALPDLLGISKTLYRNILMRISLTVRKVGNEKRRYGFVKIPFYDEFANKYKWLTVERFPIPELPHDEPEYMKLKNENFFDVQLPKWREEMGMKPLMRDHNDDAKNYLKRIGAIHD